MVTVLGAKLLTFRPVLLLDGLKLCRQVRVFGTEDLHLGWLLSVCIIPVLPDLLYLFKSFIDHRLVEHVNFVEKLVIIQVCFLHKKLS